jgi:hypothetical protein
MCSCRKKIKLSSFQNYIFIHEFTKIIEKYHMTLDQWISWISQEICTKYIKTYYIYMYDIYEMT